MGQPKRTERGLNPGICPVTTAMTIICPKWAAEAWKQLSSGPRRTEDLRRSIPGISRKMLVEQLREFESHGLVSRTVIPMEPPQVEYRLTSHGRSLGPVWKVIWLWGKRHLRRSTPRVGKTAPTAGA